MDCGGAQSCIAARRVLQYVGLCAGLGCVAVLKIAACGSPAADLYGVLCAYVVGVLRCIAV
jgi:hypothetical protein